MYATSDWSVPNFVGRFGWVSKTKDGMLITENRGAEPGFRALSCGAEAYGKKTLYLFYYPMVISL